MKQGLTLGVLVALTTSTFGQARSLGNDVSSLPTLKRQSFQHFDAFQSGDHATIDFGFEGKTYLVDLERHSIRDADFRAIVFGEDGEYREYQAPPSQTYRGVVRDATGRLLDGAKAAANHTADGWVMSIDMPSLEDHLMVQPVGDLDPSLARPGLHAIYRSKDTLSHEFMCGADALEFNKTQPFEPPSEGEGDDEDGPVALAAQGQTRVKIAFDADAEYYQSNGSDVNATIADIEGLMNLIDAVYERDIDLSFELTTIIVRAVPIGLDPYNSSDSAVLNNQFTAHWNDKQKGIQRHFAHLMTGRDLDGPIIGVAARNVVCKVRAAYGLSQSRFSANMTFRIQLTAHELGHNMGSFHCDQNLLVECCTECHIMCSTLAGCNGPGLPNFGGPSARFIKRIVAMGGCLGTEQAPLTVPFTEDFNDALDPARWWFNDRIDITVRDNVTEPSEPASMKMNANKGAPGYMDDVRTGIIDTTTAFPATVSFFHQRRDVEAGEELVVEYKADGVPGWTELTRFTSDGISMASFAFESFDLPVDAYHDEFRLRFRLIANQFDDRWFIDDLAILTGTGLAVSDGRVEATKELRVSGTSPGSTTVFFYSFAGQGPGPCLERTGICLDLQSPVRVLDVVVGGVEGVTATQLFVPLDAPSTEIAIQSVTFDSLTSSGVPSEVVTVPIGR